ncbi:hypothetical protein DWB64_04010 [Fusibacter sp. A1]|nr:UvrD-helicase domain-containing protein [Fusibacter sp. A1]RXV63178.1 hypothetical protein DWB64_04010 [Fusibacter sp. A1]
MGLFLIMVSFISIGAYILLKPKDDLLIKYENELSHFSKEYYERISCNSSYITHDQIDWLTQSYKHMYNALNKQKLIKKSSSVSQFVDALKNIEITVSEMNRRFIKDEIDRCSVLFDNIDGRSLDRQQREAVVNQEINQLVLAGAGSGKTLTIAAKTKYLVDELSYKPQEILLVSFTKKSRKKCKNESKTNLKSK